MTPLRSSRKAALTIALIAGLVAAHSYADGGAEIGSQGGSALDGAAVDGMTMAVGNFFNSDSPNLSDLDALSSLSGVDLQNSKNAKALAPLIEEVQSAAKSLTYAGQDQVEPDPSSLSQQELLSRTAKLRALKDVLKPFLADQKQENLVTQKYELYRRRMDSRHMVLLTQMGTSLRRLALGTDLLNAPRVAERRKKSPTEARLKLPLTSRRVRLLSEDNPAAVSAASRSAVAIVPGDYVSSNKFKIGVLRRPNGLYNIRADGTVNGRAQYVDFDFDGTMGKVFRTTFGRQEFTLVSSIDKAGIRYYFFHQGGLFSATDQTIGFGINLATGELVSLSATIKVARWGLPPWLGGWHSGPFKITMDEFGAEGIVRAAKPS